MRIFSVKGVAMLVIYCVRPLVIIGLGYTEVERMLSENYGIGATEEKLIQIRNYHSLPWTIEFHNGLRCYFALRKNDAVL